MRLRKRETDRERERGSACQTNGTSDQWNVKLMGHRTNGKFVGLMETIGSSGSMFHKSLICQSLARCQPASQVGAGCPALSC